MTKALKIKIKPILVIIGLTLKIDPTVSALKIKSAETAITTKPISKGLCFKVSNISFKFLISFFIAYLTSIYIVVVV